MTLPDYWHAGSNYLASGADLEQINYCPNPDPIHTANAIPTGWTASLTGGHTVVWSNGAVHDGITSKHFSCAYNGGAETAPGFIVAGRVAGQVTAGRVITVAADIGEAALVGCTVHWRVQWYDSGVNYLSESSGNSIGPGSGFAQAVYSPTAPANADSFIAYLEASGFGSGDSIEFSVCEVLALTGKDAAPYYWSGDSPNCHWASARDASISHKHLVRPNGGGELIIEATTDRINTGAWSPGIAVTAGNDYGVALLCEVARCVGGTFSCDVVWYTSGDAYISGISISGWLTAWSAETAYSDVLTAPATAAQACLRFWWNSDTTPTGDCVAHVRGISFGASVLKAPAVVSLADQNGQYAAPPNLLLEAGASPLAGCYVGHTDNETAVIGDFVKPMVAAAWLKTGGGAATGAAATDTAGYPAGTGNTIWETKDATGDTTLVDVTAHSGEYAVFANVEYRVGAAGVYVKQQCGDWVPITTAALKLLYLGNVFLPTQAVRGAGVSTLAVSIKGDGTNYAGINTVDLLPVGRGVTGYVLPSGHVHTLRWEDGVLYADDAVDHAHVVGSAAPPRTLGGHLVVLAEQATAAPTTTVSTTLTVVPRWEQFPTA